MAPPELVEFTYAVRKSNRAKRLQLKITPHRGLEVIVPYRGYNQATVDAFVDSQLDWIRKHLKQQQQRVVNDDPSILPNSLMLTALQQPWQIDYIPAFGQARLLTKPQQSLAIFGSLKEIDPIKTLLKRWLNRQAKQHFPAWLTRVSQRCQLPYSKLTIRQQQTRWGSCSANKAISLNAKLLLLPKTVLEHVMIHELCHTQHLNHSTQFWQTVAQFDPDWRTNKQLLKKANDTLPLWVM